METKIYHKRFYVKVIHVDKHQTTKSKTFEKENRTVFLDDVLPPYETSCTAYMIIIINSVYRLSLKSIILKDF